jgi:hypothetical protein
MYRSVPTVTVVTLMRLNIALYVLCLSCLLRLHIQTESEFLQPSLYLKINRGLSERCVKVNTPLYCAGPESAWSCLPTHSAMSD